MTISGLWHRFKFNYYTSPVAIFCRGIILGVEPAEMEPLSNMREVNQTSVYLKKIFYQNIGHPSSFGP